MNRTHIWMTAGAVALLGGIGAAHVALAPPPEVVATPRITGEPSEPMPSEPLRGDPRAARVERDSQRNADLYRQRTHRHGPGEATPSGQTQIRPWWMPMNQ